MFRRRNRDGESGSGQEPGDGNYPAADDELAEQDYADDDWDDEPGDDDLLRRDDRLTGVVGDPFEHRVLHVGAAEHPAATVEMQINAAR